MLARLPRRRALARGLTCACGLLLGLSGLGRTLAQELSDPEPPSPIAPPSSGGPSQPATPTEDDVPRPTTASPVFAPTTSTDEAIDAEPVEEPVATGPWGVPPVKLSMPSLGVDAPVVPVGQDEDGAMAAPTDPDTVAWYEPGPGMGVPGNAVFAAHINWAGRLRVFGSLHQLEPGDPILIIDAEGHGYKYLVESSHWVRAEGAPVEEIFASADAPTVTLITCGGEYVAATREYLDRLIVRAKGA
jgi:sortase (surface protein transpeptidase)